MKRIVAFLILNVTLLCGIQEVVFAYSGTKTPRSSKLRGSTQKIMPFKIAAERILHLIARGDLADFRKVASEDGILVVRRELDWKRTEKEARPLKEPSMPKIPPQRGNTTYGMSFYMGGQDATIRKEVEVMFASSELGGKAFKHIFRQFEYFISEQYRSWPAGLEVSLNLNAAGYDPHFLGPAAEGKMASNYFWHVYFLKQNGMWRVWKLEAEYTH